MMIIEPTRHALLSLLQQGVESWNQQRPRVRMELLQKINTYWEDFDEVNFARRLVDLSQVDLSGTDLQQIDLSHSRLEGTTLRAANGSRANVSHASMRRADLAEANLRGPLSLSRA